MAARQSRGRKLYHALLMAITVLAILALGYISVSLIITAVW
jgi:hypothetical protein